MTWGDVIRLVRRLHLQFFEKNPSLQFSIESADTITAPFDFPKATGVSAVAWSLADCDDPRILFHPVERFLIEGPLSVFEILDLDHEGTKSLLTAITNLEADWADTHAPELKNSLLEEWELLIRPLLKPKPLLRLV